MGACASNAFGLGLDEALGTSLATASGTNKALRSLLQGWCEEDVWALWRRLRQHGLPGGGTVGWPEFLVVAASVHQVTWRTACLPPCPRRARTMTVVCEVLQVALVGCVVCVAWDGCGWSTPL